MALTPQPAPEPTEQAEPSMPLDEFCRELSRTERSVELIAVFAHRERAAGRDHDTATAYRSRFDDTHASPTAGNARPVSV